METKIAQRSYASRPYTPPDKYFMGRYFKLYHPSVFVFDTETTTNTYMNLKIGYFQQYASVLQKDGLFYDPEILEQQEIAVLKQYASENSIRLMNVTDFIDKVFYPLAYGQRYLCMGYNLAFDISRLAKKYGDTRGRNAGGFNFTLSDNKSNPHIVIKKVGYANSFRFAKTKSNQGKDYFSGYFLDVQRLAEVLLDSRHIPLSKACKVLNTDTKKLDGVEYGTVTPELLKYLIFDVRSTYEVYEKLMQELIDYDVLIPPTSIYSSASIAKHALEQMGVTPFMTQGFINARNHDEDETGQAGGNVS